MRLFDDLVESTLLAGGKSKKDGYLVDPARGQADPGSAAVYNCPCTRTRRARAVESLESRRYRRSVVVASTAARWIKKIDWPRAACAVTTSPRGLSAGS
jgi:hypothetical protein